MELFQYLEVIVAQMEDRFTHVGRLREGLIYARNFLFQHKSLTDAHQTVKRELIMHVEDSAHIIVLIAQHKCLIVRHLNVLARWLTITLAHRNEEWCEHILLRIIKDTPIIV